jgi:HEAT repeat protein
MRCDRSGALAVLLLCSAAPVMAQDTTSAPAAAPRASYDQVVAQLKSPDAASRRDSLRALGATAYPEAIAPISQLLTDPLDDIQLETIYTLLSFYHVERPEVLDRRKGLTVRPTSRLTAASQRIYELGPYGLIPQPVPVELTNGLAQSMFDQNPKVRLESVYALGVMARPPLDGYAADALPRLLQDSVEDIREAAARVIGGLRVTTAGDALVGALNDKSTRVATAAMRALGDIKAWQSLQALTDQFHHYNGKGPRAEAALDALARIAHASSQQLFTAQLTSSNANLRRLGAEGLARSGNREAAQQAGMALAADKQTDVLLAGAFAAVVGSGESSGGVTTLVSALDNGVHHEQAMAYLVELGPRAVAGLDQALASTDPATRERATLVLGFIGGNDALVLLERARGDKDLRVVRAAERAIARLRKAE